MTQIQVGSVVRLKSGGPDMTVTHLYDDKDDKTPVVECHWFMSSGKDRTKDADLEHATFPVDALNIFSD